MNAITSVTDIAQIVARNVVPLAGSCSSTGQSAPNVLILYFVDTLLSMAVIFAGVARTFAPAPKDDALIIVYIGASIFAEAAPDRLLEVMPGGGGELTKEASIKPSATAGRGGLPSQKGAKR